MKKATKETIAKIINERYGNQFNTSVRFSTSNDSINADAICEYNDNNSSEIILKSTTLDPTTVAHELAHAGQYRMRGESECMSYDRRTVPNYDLISEHENLGRKIFNEMKSCGMAQIIGDAAGIDAKWENVQY
jgi:hypothetical protein